MTSHVAFSCKKNSNFVLTLTSPCEEETKYTDVPMCYILKLKTTGILQIIYQTSIPGLACLQTSHPVSVPDTNEGDQSSDKGTPSD